MKPYWLLSVFPIALLACAGPSSSAVSSTQENPLHAYHWKLNNAQTASGQKIGALFVQTTKPVQLDFSGNRLSVSNTCNRMGGGYSVAGNKMTFSPMASTMMSCADARLSQLDREVSTRLQGTATYLLQTSGTPSLRLTTASGDVLTFTGTPTAEARFGQEGETAFLEVAAKTTPCSHPLIPNKQCLQVREVRYDSKGLKTGYGAWQNFYQDIEGYNHQNGVRNVLRVKRYKVTNPPADAPDTAYVLDMIVETDLSAK